MQRITEEQSHAPVRLLRLQCRSGSDLSRHGPCAWRNLGGQGIDLVYGGASVGLMGAVADAALAKGGHVIGVMPQALVDKEIAHRD